MGSLGRKFKPRKNPGKKIKYTTELEAAITKFRNSTAWINCRLSKLATDPICQYPGCQKGAQDVHHIDTLAEEYPYFESGLDHDNLRSLCKVCHGKITQMENAGLKQKAKDIFK